MKRHLLIALAAVFVVGMAASAAHAQCSFQHPRKAAKLDAFLVQAFVSCGNAGAPSPNAMTESGTPSCQPPETFSAANGTHESTGGWKWDPASSYGRIKFQSKRQCAGLTSPGAPPACTPGAPFNAGPPPAADLKVYLNLRHILAGPGAGTGPASGTGILSSVTRATLNDNTNGDMTIIDFPTGFSFTMSSGSASLRSSADALLNANGLKGLPPCTSLEVVHLRVIDSKGDAFAVMGNYLPAP